MRPRGSAALLSAALLPALLTGCGAGDLALPPAPPAAGQPTPPELSPGPPVPEPEAPDPLGPAAPAPQEPPQTSSPAPSPSVPPEPGVPAEEPPQRTPPRVTDLILSPDGLDTLVIGEPIDSPLATWNPHACRLPENEEHSGLEDDSPLWGAWVPNYPAEPTFFGSSGWPFEVYHRPDQTLGAVVVWSPRIRTTEGISILSTEADVRAAYPSAEVLELPYVRVYGIAGARGKLIIEVLTDAADEDAPTDVVWNMRVESADAVLDSLYARDGIGVCDLIH